ncbi:ABC transporter substrate-binding protein [Microbacterium sp. LWH11-1.2]|uniref:ABC transporter substrate-binding protein n=1 Tax=unclassified Microbacterium TaxID=2609290 RepID=UPI00313929C7
MRSRTSLVALMGAAALALTSCAASGASPGGGGDTGALAEGKTFTTVISTDPGSLDPLITVMSVARSIDRFLYSRLVEVQDDGSVVSGLASEWEADTTTATFTLRDGVTCEDGTPLTATDVAANISHIGDPANGSPLVGLQVQPGTSAVGDDDAGTVTVTSGRPDSFLLQNIGSIAIVCGTVLDDPDALAKGEGATGMFTMTEIIPNSQYTLTRREDFTWGPGDWDPEQAGLPEKVVFRVVPNETTATNLLLSGEVNAALVIGPDAKRLEDAGLFKTALPVAVGQMIFNQAEGRPTADQEVREALMQALDLPQLRQVLTGGVGTVPTGLVTISPNPCRADVVDGFLPEVDAKAAAKALDDAGWIAGSDGIREKDGKRLELGMIYSSLQGDAGNAGAELIQATWKELGVDLTVKSADSPTLSETLFVTGDWDVSAAPITVSLPSMLVPFYSGPTPPNGTNFASIENADYTAAVTAASNKAGDEGCDDWGKAEQALYATTSVIPFANQDRSTYAQKATFIENDGIDPASIRMYE